MGVSVESKLESLEYPDERGFSKGEIAGKSDGTALEVAGIDSTDHDHLSAREAWSIGWAGHAGTKMDAWLTSSCAQIGQVMLALPSALAKTGLIAGIPLMIVYGALSTWTIHNITALYVAMKRAKIQDGTWYLPGTTTRGKATQYYEVVAFHTNKWIGAFTLITTVIGLLSTGIAQVIACAANTYFIDDSHNKRYYAIIWGAVLSSVFVLIPTFKHFRLLSILGIVGTAWTAVYIWAASGIHGLGDNWQTGPTSLENFFLGLNVILNAFGGHGMSIEIMDSMYKPSKFDRVYPFSTLFTYIVTVPHSVLAVLAFGVLNVTKANVYAVLPNNAWRTVSIVLMLFHQCVAYSLYVTPVFFMAEKALGVHGGAYWKRILARAPVALLVWFFGVAFPFYGVINSFMGSYAGSLTAFILPASVYLWTFRSKTAREESLKQPPRIVKGNWFAANSLNILIILAFTVTGLGFGMWASVLSFIQNIQTLGVFAACYQCGKKH